jgi:hypothetical protein
MDRKIGDVNQTNKSGTGSMVNGAERQTGGRGEGSLSSPICSLCMEYITISLDSTTGSTAVKFKIGRVLNCNWLASVAGANDKLLTNDHMSTGSSV